MTTHRTARGRIADELGVPVPRAKYRCITGRTNGDLGRAYLPGSAQALAMSAMRSSRWTPTSHTRPQKSRRCCPAAPVRCRCALAMCRADNWMNAGAGGDASSAGGPTKCGRVTSSASARATLPRASSAGGARRCLASAWTRVQSNGYAFQVEMTYLTERLGFKVIDNPDLTSRTGGSANQSMSVPVKLPGCGGMSSGSGGVTGRPPKP